MEIFERSKFAFSKKNNILCDGHIGISGNRLSVLTPESAIGQVRCLQACPYSNSVFNMDVRIAGERVAATDWKWLPNVIFREGKTADLQVETIAAIPNDMRTLVFSVSIKNNSDADLVVPITLEYRGEAKKFNEWYFVIPDGNKFADLKYQEKTNSLMFYTDEKAVTAITTSVPNMSLLKTAYLLHASMEIAAGESKKIYFSAHLGSKEETEKEMSLVENDYEFFIQKALNWAEKEEQEILNKLPKFSSSNESLTKLYYRALVTYITNKWEVPEFAINPYYSTGSTNGGCMCSYLWDYSGGMYVHPLVCSHTNEKEIEIFLRNDITNSYAIMPVDAKPCGPWYQINQEKIISMVYYHVLHTGDKSFLHKKVGDKTIADWMVFHALVGDDVSKPVQLIDYGEGGKDHLELRHELQYRGVMPDLNARRYMNYVNAYKLTEIAGNPCPMLLDRAEQLKGLIMQLWNPKDEWFDFIWDGKRESRKTVQMFKFLTSDVITKDIKEKLIKHLNEEEFLSEYGLHSMSKLDPAFDQDDIDNGGGGICTEFAAVIIGQLYDIGEDALASDILSRILWWGTRLPYLGDSCAANMQLQREDTPLQADISSVSLAQTILFKLSGVSLDFDGKVHICPPKNHLATCLKFENFKLGTYCFTLIIEEDNYEVKVGDKIYRNICGEEVVIG